MEYSVYPKICSNSECKSMYYVTSDFDSEYCCHECYFRAGRSTHDKIQIEDRKALNELSDS